MMTIQRVRGESSTEREDLGRVLVTIDDLDTLISLLVELSGSLDDADADCSNDSPVTLRFDGGYFTEAEDLRRLSDIELKSLTIETAHVQVYLQPDSAHVIGSESDCDEVYRTWARGRQSNIRRSETWAIHAAQILFGLLILVGIIGLFGIPPIATGSTVERVGSGFVVVLGIVASWFTWLDRSEQSSALVVPLTLAEFRQTRSTQKYPRRSWIVAMVTAGIAVGAIAATVLTKVLGS